MFASHMSAQLAGNNDGMVTVHGVNSNLTLGEVMAAFKLDEQRADKVRWLGPRSVSMRFKDVEDARRFVEEFRPLPRW